MSLFQTPEQHAANGPDTWRVEKVRDGLWAIVTAQGSAENAGDRLETYPTRKSAMEGLETGWAAQLWEKERRWYAGESIPGWKSWAGVKAEQERTEKRNAERKADRLMRAWLDLAEAERLTFPDSQGEAEAIQRTESAYQELVAHLDAHDMTGSTLEPRGEKVDA